MSDTETLLTFPCEFPVKAMGKASPQFAAEIIALVKKHAPDLDVSLVTTRASQNGNYLAVTVTITATSRAQLDAIYQDITAHPDVNMAL